MLKMGIFNLQATGKVTAWLIGLFLVFGGAASMVQALFADRWSKSIFGVLSVVEFARVMRDIEGAAVDLLGGMVREWP